MGDATALQSRKKSVQPTNSTMTPVLALANVRGSAVSVTGSHNPPDYNGLKMVLGGETLAGEAIQALRARIAAHIAAL